MKKIFVLVLCLVIAASALCACEKKPSESEETTAQSEVASLDVTEEAAKERVVTLAYTAADTFNPYKTESGINKDIALLAFDSLFRINSSYEPIPSLALSYEESETSITVELRDDVSFTTGEMLNPRDILYSFQYAKTSPLFAAQLSNFFNCTIENDCVVFGLIEPDINAVNCLDFPIIKFGTGEDDIPTGCGRYEFIRRDGEYVLVRNEDSSSYDRMEQETIKLLDISTVENELYLLQIGELTCYCYDPSLEKASRISASTATVGLNNMVYLGFNSSNPLFSDKNIRNAIAMAVDKASIADNSYDSLAEVTSFPFNPAWSKTQSLKDEESEFNSITAGSLLDKSGYVFYYSTNKYRSKDNVFLKLDLIVNNENSGKLNCARMIKSQLENIGIEVTLSELDYDSYVSRLRDGLFDLYVGEVKLPANMDLSMFFSPEGSIRYGISNSGNINSAYSDFLRGTIDITTFAKVFDEEKPFVPICFRQALMYYSRELKYEAGISENDIFSNIYSWSF